MQTPKKRPVLNEIFKQFQRLPEWPTTKNRKSNRGNETAGTYSKGADQEPASNRRHVLAIEEGSAVVTSSVEDPSQNEAATPKGDAEAI